jgi:hypothetical protein
MSPNTTANEQGIYNVSCSTIVFALLFFLRSLELFFPQVVGLVLVQIWKHQVEHIREPFYWMPFDALFYVLVTGQSHIIKMRGSKIYIRLAALASPTCCHLGK